jgi:hypothetical protein
MLELLRPMLGQDLKLSLERHYHEHLPLVEHPHILT